MIQHRRTVAGEPVTINYVETEEDLDGFREFIRRNIRFLGLDSETTGLDIYGESFSCRLVQFGTPRESYVVPVEKGGRFRGDVCTALGAVEQFVLHNASFDLQVFDRCLGVPMESLWPKVTDTRILAHLVDPRGKEEGGTGHSLEDLTRSLIDPEIADNVKTLMKTLATDEGIKPQADVWKLVDLNNPIYQVYSGMDPILASRLLQKLLPLIPSSSTTLVSYEHELASVCSYMERRGFLLDDEYTSSLSKRLKADQEVWESILFTEYGIEKVNSTEDCAEALEVETGARISGRTPSGNRKLDKTVLESLIADGNTLAEMIQETKRLGKWRTTWVDGFLAGADADGRCHASINPLRARTARMSITGIPAQTLPAGDWMIRRCFIADPGEVIASVDYQSQELRVLAALSGDRTMIEAFRHDADLHQITADAAGVDRKVGKMANFLVCYGGGPGKFAGDANIPYPVAKKVLDTFNKTYPGVTKLSHQLQVDAEKDGYITTPVGRRLPVDQDRPWAVLNYLIQSTSRDVTGRALIRLHEAGFTPNLRLPIHDEVLASVPVEHAAWGAKQIAYIMAEDIGPVHIGTDAEVGGRSWGSLYGAEN